MYPLVLDDRFAACTTHLPQIAVQFDNVAAPSLLMQPVDILRYKCKALNSALYFCQGEMSGIWTERGDQFPSPVIEFPYQLGVPRESFRGGQVNRSELLPQTALTAKGGNARFG